MEKMLLPKGVQDFRYLRKEGFYYVDKTAYIDLLMKEKLQCFFLSRPRRFGKSLFVGALKEAIEGNEELFDGLALHDTWDWSIRHPVIHISLSGGRFLSPGGLTSALNTRLRSVERRAGIDSSEPDPASRFFELIEHLHTQSGQGVVILVDEYDKPILEAIEHPDIAIANRDLLGAVYSVIKDVPDMIRLCFFTGVSRFAKTSLFSGMNNFIDLTIDPKYSSICGYTESDLDEVFGSELVGLDREMVREWYNGYSWLGEEKLYNPHDILFLLENRKFQPWWFKTGTPSFMIDALKKKMVMSVELDLPLAHGELLESFDIDNINTKALLFQAGYLTITEEQVSEDGQVSYQLDFPNREIRQSLNQLLLDILIPGTTAGLLDEREILLKHLSACDVEGMKTQFQKVLAGIPKQWHAPVDLTQYEAYFASTFYSYFTGMGLMVRAEDATNRGRIDLVVTGPSYVYIFELKMVSGNEQGTAVKQILDKEYAQKYRGSEVSLYLVGVEISKETHNIVRLDVVNDNADSGCTKE